VTGQDGSTPGQDGSAPHADGGTDAGAGTPDTGTSHPDTGTGNPDTGTGTPDSGTGTPDTGTASSPIKTVFLIMMENHNWSSIKGSASAPYINGLLATAAHAENYFDTPAKVHPSQPNYIWLEAGNNLGFTADYATVTSALVQSTTSHLVTELTAAGVPWHAYAEGVTAGSCPISTSGTYAPKHVPMLWFSDVVGSTPSTSAATCISHIVPYSQLATDIAAGGAAIGGYNMIVPDLCDDMHNATGCATSDEVANGDTWLSTEVPKIMASPAYSNGGAIFITWDESEGGEFPIGMIVLSSKAKVGYSNTTQYYHSSMLKTAQEIFKVTPLLGDAANQADLADLFTSFP
jgi:hypothetical protein